jgi:hypothetical protein
MPASQRVATRRAVRGPTQRCIPPNPRARQRSCDQLQLHATPASPSPSRPTRTVCGHTFGRPYGGDGRSFSRQEATVSRVTSNLWNNYSSTDQLLSRILTFFLNVELELNCLVSTSQTIPPFNQPLGPSLFSVRMCIGRVANLRRRSTCVLAKGTRGGSSGPGFSGV